MTATELFLPSVVAAFTSKTPVCSQDKEIFNFNVKFREQRQGLSELALIHGLFAFKKLFDIIVLTFPVFGPYYIRTFPPDVLMTQNT